MEKEIKYKTIKILHKNGSVLKEVKGDNLREADLRWAKFYGKTDTPKKLKKNQVEDFLAALGFEIE